MVKHKKDKHIKNLTLDRVSSSFIETMWLLDVTVDGKEVELNESWKEFILILISIVIKEYKDDAAKVMYDNNVMSNSISMYNNIVAHPSYDMDDYDLYKIDGAYIEFREEKGASGYGKDYIQALKGLCRVLRFSEKDIRVKLIKLEECNSIKRVLKSGSISDILSSDTSSIKIKEITILGVSEQVVSNEQALIKYALWAWTVYSDRLKTIDKSEISTHGIGVCTAKEIDEKFQKYKYIKIGDIYIYYTTDLYQIIRFIKRVSKKLNISLQSISFKYEVISTV